MPKVQLKREIFQVLQVAGYNANDFISWVANEYEGGKVAAKYDEYQQANQEHLAYATGLINEEFEALIMEYREANALSERHFIQGPWEVFREDGKIEVVARDEGYEPWYIAEVYNTCPLNAGNTNLIVSAPDMYQLLVGMIELPTTDEYIIEGRMERAKRIIEKVRSGELDVQE